MEGDGSDERILALAEPYMCGGEQPVMHARVVREQVMRTLLSPPSAASAPALGQLIITNFALLFIVERSSGSTIATTKRDVNDLWWNSLDIKVPLGAISRVEAKKDKYVRIHCKDFRILQFTMPYTLADPTNTKKQMELTSRKIESTLRMFAFSGKLKNLFAFSHTLSTKRCINGWERANVRKDLQRMGLPTDKWRISDSNRSYLICPTYPSVLGVPANVNDMTLHKVGGFRSKGRIPILSWVHPKNEATITRAAQPLVGIGGSRSTEDEHLIKEIIRATPSLALVIMDARPKVNAAANKARGAGYETMSHYAGEISGMSEDSIAAVAEVEGLEGGIGQSGALEFLGIDNIHVMRDSEKKLKEICNHLSLQDKGWLTALDNSRWLDYISLLLACTRRMVLTIESGISIFTHCSDGWDRTSQLSALAMLCLDPYYRTIEGFGVLIEREWLAAGHKFQQRYGHGDKHHDDSNRSPIFPQFVDCVYQLLHQYPTCFEFNEDFLVTILDALYSCQYGTFLCNSEKERHEAQLHSKTVSLWSYTDKHKDRFTSRAYIPYDQVLVPQSLAKHLKFWSLYFMRFCRFNEHNADRWCRDNLLVNTGTHKQARASGKKGKKVKNGKSGAAVAADGQSDDLLQHLAEREKWKKDLANREAEAKRMKQLAEKHMEQALRLKSRLTYERKRAAFFLERLDQAAHQGSDRLEHEWTAEWKKRREAGVAADDDDDDNYDLDDDDDDDEFDERQAKSSSERKKTKAEEEPDELVEFFIRSPTKQRLPVTAKSSPAVAVVPPLPLNSSNDANNPPPMPSPPSRLPPMPSPPSRLPPPPPGGATAVTSPATSSPSPSVPPSSSLSPLPSPSTRLPPPIRSPPSVTSSLASGEPTAATTSPMTFGLIRAFGQTTAPPSLSPRSAAPASLVSAASHAGDATRPALPAMPEGKLSLHRQMGKKLIPFLMRRPTREDLVARRILLPAEEDILMALESRGSIDETGSSPYTSHRTDESEDDDASTTPGATPPATPPALIDEMDDMTETDRDFLLRAASAASGARRVPSSYTSAANGGSGVHRTDMASPPQTAAPAPSSSGPNVSSGSSWLSSASQPPRSKMTSSAHVPFTPAHHRSGNGSLASGSSGAQLPSPSSSSAATATAVSSPEPKRGLIQRFVSEKDIGASSVRKPGSRP